MGLVDTDLYDAELQRWEEWVDSLDARSWIAVANHAFALSYIDSETRAGVMNGVEQAFSTIECRLDDTVH
jgi:hypothetical protein